MKRRYYMNRVFCLACGSSWKERKTYSIDGTFTCCDRCEVIWGKKNYEDALIRDLKKRIRGVEKIKARRIKREQSESR